MMPNDLPMSMRTSACEQNYQDDKVAGNTQRLELVDSLKKFMHWRIIPNDYCYCVGYKTSHLLVIKRADCKSWFDLTDHEKTDLDIIKREYLYENYDQIIENCPHRRSVPHLFHFHLMQFYDNREDMQL